MMDVSYHLRKSRSKRYVKFLTSPGNVLCYKKLQIRSNRNAKTEHVSKCKRFPKTLIKTHNMYNVTKIQKT